MLATELEALGRTYGVPEPDVVMIALNAHGLANLGEHGRARCNITIDGLCWRSILATGRPHSPFTAEDGTVLYDGRPVAQIDGIGHDDARLAYFRHDRKVVTLNTNQRSQCTGCVFCPNTGLDANDPRIVEDSALVSWLEILLEEAGLDSLSGVREMNLSTSCFETQDAAIAHLEWLSSVLRSRGFDGRLGILSSVIRDTDAFARLQENCGPFAVFLTLECVTRRRLWLKSSKASLTPDESLDLLANARTAGCGTGVTLVVGLDPIDQLATWLTQAVPHLTDFPNLQIFQVHGSHMGTALVAGDNPVEFFLKARTELEDVLSRRPDLRPSHWQNYRPLWFTGYRGHSTL